jgi:nicotinamide riboside transporter PnuC
VEGSPIIKRTDLAWVAYIVAGIVLILAMAVLVGMALSSLSFPWGPVVALVLVVLAAGLLAPELRSFWARLPR